MNMQDKLDKLKAAQARIEEQLKEEQREQSVAAALVFRLLISHSERTLQIVDSAGLADKLTKKQKKLFDEWLISCEKKDAGSVLRAQNVPFRADDGSSH